MSSSHRHCEGAKAMKMTDGSTGDRAVLVKRVGVGGGGGKLRETGDDADS